MPQVSELFGFALGESGSLGSRIWKAQCPHTGTFCDGGGNRDMARWPASEQPLAPLFDPTVSIDSDGFIPCGVCSVRLRPRGAQEEVSWAICPHRLLNFRSSGFSESQRALGGKVLRLAGFGPGDTVDVWSEVTLRDADTGVDYRLDYVLRKAGGNGPPVIVEIMTCSTSAGNKKKRTDIRSAFCDSVLYANGLRPELGRSPGVNVRQVWARMASQLIVKSEIARAWGGCAIWVIQDELADYIRKNTGLRLDELRSETWVVDEVNVVTANLGDPDDIQLYAGPVHTGEAGASWLELLRAPGIPRVETLTRKLTSETVAARLIVEGDEA